MYISQETLPEVCHTIHQLLEKTSLFSIQNIRIFQGKYGCSSLKSLVFFVASRKAFKKNHLQFNQLFTLHVNDFTKIQKEGEST